MHISKLFKACMCFLVHQLMNLDYYFTTNIILFTISVTLKLKRRARKQENIQLEHKYFYIYYIFNYTFNIYTNFKF